MSKVAFLALTDSSFQRDDIMKAFFNEVDSDKYNLYIHNKKQLKSSNYFAKFTLPDQYKVETQWAHYSLELATIKLMEYALEHDSENTKFILITDSHIPLQNMTDTCHLIHKKFNIASFHILGKQPYSHRNFEKFSDHTENNPLMQFKCDLAFSQWFICNRNDAAAYVKAEPELRQYFNLKDQCFPDEYYFPLLSKHLGIKYQIKNHCYSDWKNITEQSLIAKGYRNTPLTYQYINTAFIYKLRQAGLLFLRKVHPSTSVDTSYIFKHMPRLFA